ncbi:Ribosomal large subunit pseudouridine synthase D (23S rRNA pseudouridine(1911/1915/1917) synthase) (rRNA pseudouridylate synthase D) (rRNA-uridine isomerase D) [Durusdinium trenchii]|uniref:Ribosomal large subunit pseudouridine synthase D (23S rRNA pseudouridine(1911/1915/1917) synthase) (rRNA pseudouridylate synthase D) (rRNA-uridine isomerase D) n=1 Tax=Durusdinium trenchii TaxID=1381693 RepID=A0ABP0L581_9DINO
MRRIGEASALQIAHFDAQDLANGMWSFAKLEERPPERLWCSWPDQVFQTLQEATLQNLAMTTWSIATLGSPTPALLALMPKVAAEAALRLVGKRILPNRSALQEISNLLWSFPTLELSIPEELLTISEQHLQKTLPQQLAQVLCQVQKETAQEPQEAFDFATSILELTWALAFSGDGDGPRGALLTLLRNTLMEVAEALDRTSQWWLRRLDSSRSSGRFWPESGRTCDEELPRREELEWPVLQLNLPEVAVVLKPPYWEVDAHAPTTAPDATAPHDAKLSSFLQGVEGWEDFPLIFSEEHQFGILHRLDLPSSGLILVGKTFRGYFSLRWQQDTYDLGRNYLVLCHGVVEEQVVNARLKTTKSNPVSSCVSASGKPAWTHFQPLLLLSRGTEKYTLLIVVIRTGRTHQIRVHAQHIGHPTVADTKYGGALAAEDLRWCPRNFLHRFQLRFQDPAGRPHTASAPLPGDLRAALARLRAEGAEERWRGMATGVSGVSPRIQQAPAPTLSHPEPTAPVPTQMAPPYPAACRPRPRLSSTNSAENLGQNVQWSRPPADVHSRLLYLEHSFMELRSDMERRSQELSTQVESLAQTLHRLDGQMLHGKTNGEAACSCPQLKKIVSLTLLELEKLTRRANDAFDRSACSSIKQIQELQHLTESIDRGQAEAAQAEEGSDCRSEATCSPHRRVGELSPATVQGSPWRGSSAATCPPGAEVELEEAMRLS